MKLKIANEKLNKKLFGFEFKNGLAEIPKEDEAKAKSIAIQLNYEIVDEAKPEAKPKAEAESKPKKKAASKKAKAPKEE